MKAVYELIRLLPDESEPSLSGMQYTLFLFLKDHRQVLSEHEAAILFLKSKTKHKYFNKIKNRLKQELAEYIISNHLNVAFTSTHARLHAAYGTYKVLLTSGKLFAAAEVALRLLPKLIKSELHTPAYSMANDLHLHYCSNDLSTAQARKYQNIAKQQFAIVQAESTVRQYYGRIVKIKNTRESYTPSMMDVFKEGMEKTLSYLSLGSHMLNRLIYNMALIYYVADGAYSEAIRISDEAIMGIPVHHPNRKALYFFYTQMSLPALIALKQLKTAKERSKICCQIMTAGGVNWHLAFSQRCVICLHEGEYQEAYDLYKEHAKYPCTHQTLGEYWAIIWGYIYFLVRIGKITQYTEERFHLGRFLNETPTYSKDKAGNNINIIIIQIITRLERKQFAQIIDRIDAIKSYKNTHIHQPDLLRTNIFINMLLKMEAASFHRAATERKTKKLFEKLQTTPLRLGKSPGIEIIPYEILWQDILALLENKHRTPRQHSRTIKH